jgi:ATP-dependent DNA helicase PIF1
MMHFEGPGHIFLTGNAGTGKTTLINEFVKANEGRVIVLAPTGIAAVNCGGMTIHKFFSFPARPLNFASVKKLDKFLDADKIAIINNADYFVIDEISMVRADIMDQIGWYFEKNFPGKVLGGKKFIMVGDLDQLPPVIASDDEREMLQARYKSEFFFDADLWTKKATFKTIKLTKVWRQSDPVFIDFLNNVKTNNIKQQDLDSFNGQCLKGGQFQPTDGIMLCTTNAVAQMVNTMMVQQAPGELVTIQGIVSGDFNHKNCPVELNIELKIGCRVMTVRNAADGTYCNGTIGTLKEIQDDFLVITLDNGDEIEVGKYRFESVEYTYDKSKDNIKAKVNGQFIQFPIKIAYALTIHKSQGQTFDKVIIDLGERGAFAHGQVYVALSRCRTMEGIILRRPIKMKDLIYRQTI